MCCATIWEEVHAREQACVKKANRVYVGKISYLGFLNDSTLFVAGEPDINGSLHESRCRTFCESFYPRSEYY